MSVDLVQQAERLIGTTVAERYLVEDIVGVGGMAAVLRACELSSGQRLALKVLIPDEREPSFNKRFVREARLASRIRHPNVVRVRDVGRFGAGSLYIAMELIEGHALHDMLDAGLGVGLACGLMVQTLDALAYVHARGILHRDIKPDNILVRRGRTGALSVKVADFGIAAMLEDDGSERLTQDGMIVGTPDYIAPEIIASEPFIGPPADIYAVGVILYRILGGFEPFDGSMLQRLASKLNKEPPRLEPRQGVVVPPQLVRVVRRMMARRPEERYGTAADARAALLPFLGGDTGVDDTRWRAIGAGRASTVPPESSHPRHSSMPPPHRVPLWGREVEWQRLERFAEQSEVGGANVVLLRGDSGVGKTALMTEFALRVAEEGRFSVLQAGYQRAAGADGGLRGAFERMLGTVGRDREALEAAVEVFFQRRGASAAEDVAALVDYLRPTIGSRQNRHEAFALVVRVLRFMCGERPVMLALDDLQEGGAGAAAFLEYLLFEASYEPLPLMALATLRADMGDERFERALGRSNRYEGTMRHSWTVAPIERGALVDALVGRGLPLQQAQRLAKRSGGNPLYAHHLAAAVAEGRAVPGKGSAPLAPVVGTLPQSLLEILQHSLRERLEATESPELLEGLLVQLSVLGEQAAVELLEGMTGLSARELDDGLDVLVEHEILIERGGAELVGFTHGLFRDALLAGLSTRELRRLHGRAAVARQRHAGERADADAGAIGDHLASAGNTGEAVDWWLRALEYERAAGDVSRGARFGQSALATMADDEPRRPHCALTVARLLRDVGEMSEAVDVLEPIVADGSPTLALRAGEVLAEILQEQGEGASWGELLDELAEKHALAAGDDFGAYYRARAFWLNHQGAHAEGRRVAELALAASAPGSDAQRAAVRLAWACKFVGDLEAARAAADRAAELAGDDPELTAEALRMQTFTRPPEPGPEGTVPLAMKALELHRRSGRAVRVVRGLSDLATAMLLVGEQRSALARFAEAERLAASEGMAQLLGCVRLFSIVAALELGQHAGVLEDIELAKGLFVKVGSAGFVPLWDLCAACYHAEEGDYDAALGALEAAGDLDSSPFSSEFGRVMARLGHALVLAANRGHPEAGVKARWVLTSAQRYLEERALDEEAAGCRAAAPPEPGVVKPG